MDVCSELIGNRSVILSPLNLDATSQVQHHLEPQNSPRASSVISRQPLQSPSRAGSDVEKIGQSEVVSTALLKPTKDPKKNVAVLEPEDPNLWTNINKLICHANKVELNLDDDEISIASSESSMMYSSDSTTVSRASVSSSGTNSTREQMSGSSNSEKMARKPHALRKKKERRKSKSDRKMRKKKQN